MRQRLRSPIVLAALLAVPLVMAAAGVFAAANIDGTLNNRFAWSETAGWLNGLPNGGIGPGVEVTSTQLKGYIWSENAGWINTACETNATCGTVAYRVANDGAGNLSGYSWGENLGWVNFSCRTNSTCGGPAGTWGVSINPLNGEFTGQAWSENAGWISFNCNNTPATCAPTANYKMKTSWQPAAGATFVVNSNNDVDAGDCNFVHCSLREAINASNGVPGKQNINFQIAPAGSLQTISPTSALPTVTDPVTINGLTQCAEQLCIEINGAGAGASVNGLTITAGSSTVQALVINRFTASGILMQTGGGNELNAMYIGTNAAGTAAGPGNTLNGVNIINSSGNTIQNSLLSGNGVAGVQVAGSSSSTISYSYIGTNFSGTAAIPNALGVNVRLTSTFTTIINNIISGNSGAGVQFGDGATINQVVRNFIGTQADGVSPLGNGGDGVLFALSAPNLPDGNVVGGTAGTSTGACTGLCNVIAFNSGSGVKVTDSKRNQVQRNSIHDNAVKGISLNAGAGNQGIPAPVLTAAGTDGVNLSVQGVLSTGAPAGTVYTIEFFDSATCGPPAGFGQGAVWIGSVVVTTIAGGNANIDKYTVQAFPYAGIVGHQITATATDANGNTSEFSGCRALTSKLDSDGDGCPDAKESQGAGTQASGGDRNSLLQWDWFDVPVPALSPSDSSGTRNGFVTGADVLAVLYYVGTSGASPNSPNANGVKYGSDLNNNGILDGQEYDRTASVNPAKPWQSNAPNNFVTTSDALVALSQQGHSCS